MVLSLPETGSVSGPRWRVWITARWGMPGYVADSSTSPSFSTSSQRSACKDTLDRSQAVEVLGKTQARRRELASSHEPLAQVWCARVEVAGRFDGDLCPSAAARYARPSRTGALAHVFEAKKGAGACFPGSASPSSSAGLDASTRNELASLSSKRPGVLLRLQDLGARNLLDRKGLRLLRV
jgi:hypothetical protein